jgi:DNA-binding transcriptional LysR family regulator
MDRLRAMETFTRVVRAGSFSAAASQLGVSRTIVSKHVSQLENLLGVRLLNRTTRRVSLTESGTAYYEFCARIINDVEEAELSVTKLHKEPRGALKVLAPKTFGVLHVTPIVNAFSKRYPDIRITLILSDNFVDLIDNGFDLAIKLGDLGDSSLVARRLGTTRLVPCASPDYLVEHGTPQTPQELEKHNCIIHVNQTRDGIWRFRGPAGDVSVKIGGGPLGNSVLFLRRAAAEGLGIALLPEIDILDELAAGRLVTLLNEYATAEYPIHAVYPHNRHLAAKVRTFVDSLVEGFKGASWDPAGSAAAMTPAAAILGGPRVTIPGLTRTAEPLNAKTNGRKRAAGA